MHGRADREPDEIVVAVIPGEVVDDFPDAVDEIAVVTNWRRGMPSFDGRLTPREIEQVVEYTRTALGG